MSTLVTDPIRGTSEPGRYWTTTNLGEAVPDVMTPMCWSVWGESAELGWLYSMYAFGVLPSSKVVVSPDTNDHGLAVFYGRQALNVDAIRKIMADLPGVNPDDFERDLMGSVRADAPQYKGSLKRLPVILVKAPKALRSTGGELRRKHDEIYAWWLREVYGPSRGQGTPSGRPIERLTEARDRFADVFKTHCVWRFIFQGAQSAITDAAAKAGDPALATQVMSGVGDVNETRMSDDLWRLAHGELGEDEFLRTWGYHGPNEGNPYTVVWREDPSRVHSLARSYASRKSERPRDREERAKQAGKAAEAKLLAATSATQRPVMRWLVARSRNIVRTLQVGKAGYLMTLDGARAAARAFGEEQIAKGNFTDRDDAFFLTVEECVQLDAGQLPGVAEIVAERRRTREVYKAMKLPVAFRGMPEQVAADEPEDDQEKAAADRAAGRTVEFSGAASGGGRVEGRARVVLDASADVELEDGDILVCRFTDPGWAPLMSLADALVIDIGGSASHGAVVARELGIPYVIGTEIGTAALRDGDRILVDGIENVVRVLAPAGDPTSGELTGNAAG
ncbi:PEP-utilizing enzyme [Pseudonocardia acidicola]|uniref:Phosphoenolpyruvate-utilizing protein n=1 Tax=Pseudonocardia acidicola TaxID=2724939 RepID=A0ABX1S9L3_9PSEU|nr:PEP-utilizing enzyme [Pseudonocardia acidicola]NMH98259.1 phosphoenolpyruvate-utilizing protein [Pseudonocardia acidicola]